MESNHISYSLDKSLDRIDSILNESDSSFEELKEIPARSSLTYTNGFYVNCTAVFVDIRGSSELPAKHKRPTLAKLYRAYISEMVAALNGNELCSEVNIEGDSVWGIFNTPYKSHIDSAFETAARAASVAQTLNCKFKKKGIAEISVGIGASYGRALMAKAGYSGSGLNDLIWMGDVVNEASKLCSYGNRSYLDRQTMVSSVFYSNLKDENKNLLEWNSSRGCYHGNVVNVVMETWCNNNCS